MNQLEQYRAYVEQIEAARRNHTLSPQDYIDLFNSIDWFGMVQELLPIALAAEDYMKSPLGDGKDRLRILYEALEALEREEQS